MLFCLCLLSSCTTYFPGRDTEKRAVEKSSRAVTVTTAVALIREIPWVVTLKGKTEPPDRLELKAPEGGGQIGKVFVEEGQSVQRGDPLLSFDDEELRLKLALARAEIEEAEAGLEENRTATPRASRVPIRTEEPEEILETPPDSVTEKEPRSVNLYEAMLERARSQVALYEKQIQFSQVASSIAGLVTKRLVTAGQRVEGEKLLLEVTRMDTLWLPVQVPLEVSGTLDKAGPLTVRFVQMGGRSFPAEIVSIGAETTSEGKVLLKLGLSNPDLLLKVGMEGEVILKSPLRRKVTAVPSQALVKTERSTYVFKVQGEKARQSAVEVEEEREGEALLRKGVAEGEMVVVSDLEGLRDGNRVELESSNLF